MKVNLSRRKEMDEEKGRRESGADAASSLHLQMGTTDQASVENQRFRMSTIFRDNVVTRRNLPMKVQVAAYWVLIMGATSNGEEVNYSIYSVSLAMFLMTSITSSDIRASHALLFWGGSCGRCLFGAVLLGCTGILITASLRVLFMDAGNNAELVIGATTALFIEDMDNKLAILMTSVKNKWRLFWMLEILSVSSWLAFVGVIHFGNSAAVLDEEIREFGFSLQDMVVESLWGPIPWILTMWSILLSQVVVHTSRAWTSLPRTHETSVLPVSSVLLQGDGVQQNERHTCQLLPAKFCLCLSIGFVLMDFLSLRRRALVIMYLYGASLLVTAGALLAVLCSNEACTWHGAPGPLSFTWYRAFVGWGMAIFLFLFFYWYLFSFPLVAVDSFHAVDLRVIVEPTFFGKWGGHWIRRLQEFTMKKNGCIYWTVCFHAVYALGWWTIRAIRFMILSLK